MTAPRTIAAPGFGSGKSADVKSVLIFSPDADLARTLLLILEDRYRITRETTITALSEALSRERHDLILVDLFTFSEDVRRVLDVLRTRTARTPLILLRGYIPLRQDVTSEIESMGSIVFYKPVDVELVSQAIEDLLTGDRPA